MSLALSVVTLLAEEGPRNTGPDFGKASPFGLLVVVLLLVGVAFLVWSMNRHLNKLPSSFDADEPHEDGPESEPAVESEPSDNGKRESGDQSPG